MSAAARADAAEASMASAGGDAGLAGFAGGGGESGEGRESAEAPAAAGVAEGPPCATVVRAGSAGDVRAEETPEQGGAGPRFPAWSGIADRCAALDWDGIGAELDAWGCAVVPGFFSEEECARLASAYTKPELFRSRVVMERHGFGKGEYQYFAYPLPSPIARLRAALYGPLAEIANRWHAAMGIDTRFPPDHDDFIARCHAAGQLRPTPLLLQYQAGDYNCLHQDLYGEHVFPLQAAILLSQPGRDFTGGEFVLTEQRPRMQSRAEVVALEQGGMVIFPVHHRPVNGTRGVYRVHMRHGVSRLRSGTRHTVGIILHDAQ